MGDLEQLPTQMTIVHQLISLGKAPWTTTTIELYRPMLSTCNNVSLASQHQTEHDLGVMEMELD